jgi:toluene monooxygenase system protein E
MSASGHFFMSADKAGRRHQTSWEDAVAFQSLRALVERALVTYDWGEAFTVTNVVIKPSP